MKLPRHRFTICVGLCAVLLAAHSPAEQRATTTAPPPAAAPNGPKRTVSIASFGATSHFQAEFGQTDVGGGLAAMLTTALNESRSFIVVERAQLSSVLSEQELGVAGLASGSGTPRPGALIGAQFLIIAELTEFSENDKGKGLGLGFSVGGNQLSLAPQKRIGKVGIDVRFVDAQSAQVLNAFHVSEKVEAKATAVSLGRNGRSASWQNFLRTPLGEAARRAISTIATRFTDLAAQQPWSGAVVDAEGESVTINAGTEAGVKVGDEFQIRRVAKVLTDPVTGALLGRRTEEVGTMIISSVEDRLAFGFYRPTAGSGGSGGSGSGAAAPGRGDVVVARL